MIKIYHNNRCSKSREVLKRLEESGSPFDVINYTKQLLTEDYIKKLLKKIGIRAEGLIRKSEKIYKDQIKGKNLNEKELIKAMSENYKLIQRPILEKEDRAIIARPLEEAIKFIKN